MLPKLLHKIHVKDILAFLLSIKKCLLCIYYKCKQGFLWFIKRLAISISVAWAVTTFVGTFTTVYVGFGIVLFSTSAKVASIVLESIPKLMFSIFFSFLITIFILVSIPQIYNAMKAAFGTKEQSKSLQNSVNNLSNEVKDLRERYERHIAEQYHMNIKDVKKDKKYSQT